MASEATVLSFNENRHDRGFGLLETAQRRYAGEDEQKRNQVRGIRVSFVNVLTP
jgi:hypothetical protein